MKRYFTLVGEGVVAYDDETEEWTLNGSVEGRMSTVLAGQIKARLGACELTEEDALDVMQRTPHPLPREEKE